MNIHEHCKTNKLTGIGLYSGCKIKYQTTWNKVTIFIETNDIKFISKHMYMGNTIIYNTGKKKTIRFNILKCLFVGLFTN